MIDAPVKSQISPPLVGGDYPCPEGEDKGEGAYSV